jgi:hypothetical protein
MKTKIKDVKTGKILEVADPEKFMKHREAVLVDGKVEETPEVEEAPEGV